MRRLSRVRPSPAMVVAGIALIVALAGTGYAAVGLPKNSVGSAQIKPGAVGTSDIATNAVTSSKVKNGTLLRGDFKAGQIPAGPPGPQGPAGAAGPPGVAPPGYVAGVGSATGTAAQTTTSSTFVALPGAFVNVVVPTGETAVAYITFSAESLCSGLGWCSIIATVDGSEANPVVGDDFAFDSGGDSYENHSVTRVSNTLSAGTHTVQIHWSVSGGGSFRLDDWSLVVYRQRVT
jgi:hypothetical protein